MDRNGGPIIAGIGASAGGIKALQAFFEALPEHTGVAFVVIVHLSPEHRSSLPAILALRTPMPVQQVTGTVALEADHVYVIPPDRRLQITDDSVAAMPFDEPRGRRAPIDFFFRSLAERHRDAFGVVLSGGGSDGTVGVKAIKEAGGIVLVQDPAEAAHASMPRAAIATQVADVVLPVRDLARRLAELVQAKRRIRSPIDPGLVGTADAEVDVGTAEAEVDVGTAEAEADVGTADAETDVGRILAHLRARTGHDFSKYKRGTVLRRLARRMQMQRTETLGDYFKFLRQRHEEAQALFVDLLISVTTFFRDPATWEALATSIVPRLFAERSGETAIRIWVPGCATGEEAYSLAILLLEEAKRRDVWPRVQIFASDLDEDALAIGREGRYPRTIVADVSDERLQQFFHEDGDQYCVTRELRDCVLFTKHNLLSDPPFSRLDLISCRNLLIYLDRELHQQVFGVFQYALRPGRFLVLGASERAEGLRFRALDEKHRLYESREVANADAPRLPSFLLTTPRLRLPDAPVEARTFAEELQSINEELETVNGALRAKLAEVSQARQDAEDALRRSEQRYRVLVEGVSEYTMLTVDPDGRITT